MYCLKQNLNGDWMKRKRNMFIFLDFQNRLLRIQRESPKESMKSGNEQAGKYGGCSCWLKNRRCEPGDDGPRTPGRLARRLRRICWPADHRATDPGKAWDLKAVSSWRSQILGTLGKQKTGPFPAPTVQKEGPRTPPLPFTVESLSKELKKHTFHLSTI